jgi:hypothetical protein
MALARCPVCDDVLSLGISVKLNQIIICPTCLSSLQVVCLSPMELDSPKRRTASVGKYNGNTVNRQNGRKSSKKWSELDDLEDEEIIDDYLLERKLRHKSERPRHMKEKE